jgi:hypothetical protein
MATDVRIQMLQIKEELDAFLAWVEPQNPKRIIEIGAHQGGTAMHFCAVAHELVISIDLPDGEGGGIPLHACYGRNAMIANAFPHYRGVLGDSHSLTTQLVVDEILGDDLVDGLFIDGDHTLEGVTQDYEMYRCFVKPGGWIAFHDINDTEMHRAVGCVVSEFWDALKGDKLEFNVHGKWGGIGVLKVAA